MIVRQKGTPMRFAVSAKTLATKVGWLGATRRDGSRKVVTHQEDAQIFRSRKEAQLAINAMPEIFVAAGLQFSIEPLDTSAKIDCQLSMSDGSAEEDSS
jgi:hypothetical protein